MLKKLPKMFFSLNNLIQLVHLTTLGQHIFLKQTTPFFLFNWILFGGYLGLQKRKERCAWVKTGHNHGLVSLASWLGGQFNLGGPLIVCVNGASQPAISASSATLFSCPASTF